MESIGFHPGRVFRSDPDDKNADINRQVAVRIDSTCDLQPGHLGWTCRHHITNLQGTREIDLLTYMSQGLPLVSFLELTSTRET